MWSSPAAGHSSHTSDKIQIVFAGAWGVVRGGAGRQLTVAQVILKCVLWADWLNGLMGGCGHWEWGTLGRSWQLSYLESSLWDQLLSSYCECTTAITLQLFDFSVISLSLIPSLLLFLLFFFPECFIFYWTNNSIYWLLDVEFELSQ